MIEETTIRKLAAIVSADVAGYTRLMEFDEVGTLRALQRYRRDVVDPAIEKHHGRVVKTAGDGMLVEFNSVVDAVACCIEVQHEMMTRNKAVTPDRRLQFRVGVHLGDVMVDGDDIFGTGINISARLEAMADPGGICISQAVLDQVKQKLDLQLDDLGERALKNIEEPIRTYRIVQAGQAKSADTLSNRPNQSASPSFPLPERASLALMPFKNLNGDSESDYIAHGIGLGIQTLLVQLSGLFLINANAHQNYRNGEVTAAEAMKGYPVRYVLEGAVQHAGPHVRVTAQLTDLKSGAVTWAGQYDQDLEDIFSLQDKITQEVVASLSSEIMGGNLNKIWTQGLMVDGAWEYYLRGINHIYNFTKSDNTLGRQMFEKIFALLPDQSIGPGYVALTYWFDATREWSEDPARSFAEAAKWAAKAIEIDTLNDGLGYVILGSIRLLEGHFDEALALCRRGIATRANCPFALSQMAAVQNASGDSRNAVKYARAALSVRMVYPPPLVNILATAYRDNGEIALSIPAAREAIRLDPEHTDALATLCSDFALAGEPDEARRLAEQIIELNAAFRVSDYAKVHPYRDPEKLNRISKALRSAGLPE